MKESSEVSESLEKHTMRSAERRGESFDELRAFDNSSHIETFDDIRKQGSDKSIETFDDCRSETEHGDVKEEFKSGENERLSNSATKLSIDRGRHRAYVAIKEGYDNNPAKLNDVYTQTDGQNFIDRRGITNVSFDEDVLNSEDMQNLMKEHDFKNWEQGQVEHKGFTYNDHVKEFGRLHECQEAIKNGHSPNEIEGLFGKEHADTYKRFYERDPIEINRTVEME